ncbi:hypothetical protein [Campylobacter troglodytis]|uniref:hypothetical protein n=1 Tax=Campylobacter troglodytis TaxID=654363 RepID=UPI00115C0D78|nr:hypothetical protein [Campylobacter troglodytis]TQR60996.1 hypothetical protein DMC01_02985 [Campylobacter troglodytis]
MKLSFSKLFFKPYPFSLELENVNFEGSLQKKTELLIELKMQMKGFVYRPCDSCGKDMRLDIDEKIELLISKGIFKDEEGKLSDVVECFEQEFDLKELALAELESYLSGYFYCKSCEN